MARICAITGKRPTTGSSINRKGQSKKSGGIGKVPGLLAVCIYALPPIVRLTNLGIRLVDKQVMEAAEAFGASYKEKLFGVQIPLALPNIMAGVNQTIMMSLAMVVIAAMVSAA